MILKGRVKDGWKIELKSAPKHNPFQPYYLTPMDLSEQSHLLAPTSKYLQKIDIKKNAQWTLTEEKLLDTYIEKSKGYKYIYNECYNYYYNISNTILILMIILPAILTILNTTSTIAKKYKTHIQIISIFISFLMTILGSIYKQYKFSEKLPQYEDLCKSFGKYIENLETVLSFPAGARPNPIQAIIMAKSDYDNFIEKEMFMPEHIIKKYIHKYEGRATLLDLTGDMYVNKRKINDLIRNNDALQKLVDHLQQEEVV
jgi:hypothetical protein